MIDLLIGYYEQKIKIGREEVRDAPESLKNATYRKKVSPYIQALRTLRVQQGLAVCRANAECDEPAIVSCAAGKHEACKTHAKGDCAACESEQSGPPVSTAP